MRIVLIIIFIAISSMSFSQSRIYSAGEIFSVSYADSSGEKYNEEDVRIYDIDSNSVKFLVVSGFPKLTKSEIYSIPLSNITRFGYKVGIGMGAKIRNGALVGFGIGFVIIVASGAKLSSDGPKPDFGNVLGTGCLVGAIFAVPGALIGTLTGIGSKEYEYVDVSKYNVKKKHEVISNLIENGIKANK